MHSASSSNWRSNRVNLGRVSARIAGLAVVTAAALGLAAFPAQASDPVTLGTTGKTAAGARAAFAAAAENVCRERGGVEYFTVVGVEQQGPNSYYAEGYVQCNS